MSRRQAAVFPEMEGPANKCHEGIGSDGKHNWLTKPSFYAALDARHHFDFDTCPDHCRKGSMA